MSPTGRLRSLRSRLLGSYAVVIAAGATAMLVVGAVVTRTVYRRRLGGFGLGTGRQQGRPSGAGGGIEVTETQLREVLDESLLPALVAGVAAALVVAGLVAVLVSRRLLRPITELRLATRQMAAGDYSIKVPTSEVTELASLAADVNALGEHLATTEQRRSQLLGEVTHELRTPLTVIRGQVEAVLDGVLPAGDDVFLTVADEAARMQRLVDDLTTLSRADEGTLELRLVELDLAAVAAAAADRLRPQFEHARVALTIEPPANPAPHVRGDRDRLTQVFANLLGNALAHTPAGGTVTARAGFDPAAAWVDIIDTGAGIPAAELECIFQRFYRAPGGQGRGIGLTIARSLARAHEGDVTAWSAGPGSGATFRVTIPFTR